MRNFKFKTIEVNTGDGKQNKKQSGSNQSFVIECENITNLPELLK